MAVDGATASGRIPRVAPWSGLARTPHWQGVALGFVLIALSVATYGAGLHPEVRRFVDGAARAPDLGASLLREGDAALMANGSLSLIGGALRVTTEPRFIALAAITTVLALCCPLFCRPWGTADRFPRIMFLVLLGGPLAHVLLMWLGGYDALAALAMILGALSRRPAVVFASWAVAAFTHAPVAVIGLALWWAVLLGTSGPYGQHFSRCGRWSAAGVVSGWVAIQALTDLWGGSTDRLALFRAIPFEGILECYVRSLPLMLFSGLGATWVLLTWRPLRNLRVTRVFLAVSAAATLGLPLIAVDETRIIALCLVPATLAWAAQAAREVSSEDVRLIWRRHVWVAALVPVPVIWMGSAYWTSWPLAG